MWQLHSQAFILHGFKIKSFKVIFVDLRHYVNIVVNVLFGNTWSDVKCIMAALLSLSLTDLSSKIPRRNDVNKNISKYIKQCILIAFILFFHYYMLVWMKYPNFFCFWNMISSQEGYQRSNRSWGSWYPNLSR